MGLCTPAPRTVALLFGAVVATTRPPTVQATGRNATAMLSSFSHLGKPPGDPCDTYGSRQRLDVPVGECIRNIARQEGGMPEKFSQLGERYPYIKFECSTTTLSWSLHTVADCTDAPWSGSFCRAEMELARKNELGDMDITGMTADFRNDLSTAKVGECVMTAKITCDEQGTCEFDEFQLFEQLSDLTCGAPTPQPAATPALPGCCWSATTRASCPLPPEKWYKCDSGFWTGGGCIESDSMIFTSPNCDGGCGKYRNWWVFRMVCVSVAVVAILAAGTFAMKRKGIGPFKKRVDGGNERYEPLAPGSE